MKRSEFLTQAIYRPPWVCKHCNRPIDKELDGQRICISCACMPVEYKKMKDVIWDFRPEYLQMPYEQVGSAGRILKIDE